MPARRASELKLFRLGRLPMHMDSSWDVPRAMVDNFTHGQGRLLDRHRGSPCRPASSSKASATIEDERQRRCWPFHLDPEPYYLLQHLDSEAGGSKCLQHPASTVLPGDPPSQSSVSNGDPPSTICSSNRLPCLTHDDAPQLHGPILRCLLRFPSDRRILPAPRASMSTGSARE
jgi:hypothetical protein